MLASVFVIFAALTVSVASPGPDTTPAGARQPTATLVGKPQRRADLVGAPQRRAALIGAPQRTAPIKAARGCDESVACIAGTEMRVRAHQLYSFRARRRFAAYLRMRLLELREAGLGRAADIVRRKLSVDSLVTDP